MKSILNFVQGFLNRDGLYVLFSSLFLKFTGLFLSIFIVRMISTKELGEISYSMAIVGIVSVIAGFGGNWSLLRFGALQNSTSNKHSLLKKTINDGVVFSILLIFLIVLLSYYIPQKIEDARKYLIILSISLISNFIFDCINSYYRIIGKNKLFSKSNIRNSVFLILLSLVFVSLFGSVGYVISIVLAPFLSVIMSFKHLNHKSRISLELDNKEYFTYGIYTGIGVLANQGIILSGPIIAGFFTNGIELSYLKVATIIPLNLMFIPSMIMSTDFVYFSKNYQNKDLLKNYYYDYIKTIFLICFIPFVILIYFNKYIIVFLYGNEYLKAVDMSNFLLISVFFAFILRIPLGNILAAVGKANWNVLNAFFWFFIYIPLSIILFKFYEIEGIVYSFTIVFICSGIVSLFLFYKYLKTLKN